MDGGSNSTSSAKLPGSVLAVEPETTTGPLELEQELTTALAQVLPPREQEKATRIVHQVVSASFQGPLPPPSYLERYEQICPGAAERIIRCMEREQEHRHTWERRALSGERWYSMTGLVAGWTTALALAAGATAAALYGSWKVGAALAAASATGMVAKLVQGRSDDAETPPDPPPAKAPRTKAQPTPQTGSGRRQGKR